MLSHDKTNGFSIVRVFSATFATLCVAAVLFLGAAHANAAVLFFDSFEGGTGSPAYPDYADNGGGSITGLNGWTNIGSPAALVLDSSDANIANTTGGPPVDNNQGDMPNGGQIMYAPEGSSVVNTLGGLTVAGTTYTLTARMGDTLIAPPSNMSLILLFSGLPVASDSGIAATNTFPSGGYSFDTLTASFTATSSGQTIGIQIDSASVGASFEYSFVDAVQLDAVEAEAVPEPSTLVLAALGLAGLGLVAWRRKK